MTRDGNHAFEITAVPAYCDADKKLVEVIIVKGEDLVAYWISIYANGAAKFLTIAVPVYLSQ